MKKYIISEVDFKDIIKQLERLSDRFYLSENEELQKASEKIDRIIDQLTDSITE